MASVDDTHDLAVGDKPHRETLISDKQLEDYVAKGKDSPLWKSRLGPPPPPSGALLYKCAMFAIAERLGKRHRNLVEARCLNDPRTSLGRIELAFEDGHEIIVTEHSGHMDITLIKFGYSGTGPFCFYRFLRSYEDLAVFVWHNHPYFEFDVVSEKEISMIEAPRVIRRGKPIDESAISALGKKGDSEAVETLIRVVKYSEHASLREQATEALAKIGDPRAVEPLKEVFRTTRSGSPVNKVIGWALELIRDPRAIEPIIKGLRSRDSLIREEAAKVLGEFGDKRAVEPLEKALRSKDSDVRKQAKKALEKIRRKSKGKRRR